MVAVAVDELAVGECPERISLVLAVLGHHERSLEHDSVMAFLVGLLDAEAALLRVHEGLIDHNYIENAPDIPVAE